jgi:GT2 family glycosyltransferase
MAVSVVICAYTLERWPQLCAAIESAGNQSLPPEEVVVVVDHNPDLLERVQLTYPAISVVPNRGRQGLSGARNSGIAAAEGSIVVFLDDDAAGRTDWLEQLVAPFDDASVMITGGTALPVWPGGRPTWMPPEFDWVVGCTYRGMPTERAAVRNVMGCNMAFRREALDAVGPFEEAMTRVGATPVGGDETEYCIRANRVLGGGRIIFEPAAVVDHTVSQDRTTWRYFRARCYSEGISKARLVDIAGSSDGLSSERRHLVTVLPRSVLREVRRAVRGDRTGWARAGALVLGTFFAGFGYLRGRLHRTGNGSDATTFVPARTVTVDVGEGNPVVSTVDPDTGREYERIHALVRDRGVPLGLEIIDVTPGLAECRVPIERPLDTGRPLPRPDVFPPVAVVIATRNRPDALERCLVSVLACDYPDVDVIVVDNAPSSDATARMIRQDFVDTVRYVREDVAGLAVAHNRGLSLVDRQIVAFTDDDVEVDASWLAAVAAVFGEDPATACVTGLILPAELDTAAQWWANQHGNTDKGLERRSFDLETHRPDDALFPYAVGRVGSGANMAFRTAVLRELGGFVPSLGAGTAAGGGDDLAAFLAVLVAGHRITYEPAAVVHHHHARDVHRLRRQAFGYGKGLTAYLTHAVGQEPARLVDFARSAPSALRHAFNGNREPGTGNYPAELRWREWWGMAAGPFGYLRSRYQMRSHGARGLE